MPQTITADELEEVVDEVARMTLFEWAQHEGEVLARMKGYGVSERTFRKLIKVKQLLLAGDQMMRPLAVALNKDWA